MSEPLVELPNMEALVADFLRAQPEINADAWIGTAFGSSTTYPAVRVTLIFDRKVTSEPLWVVESEIQIESYGGSKAQAHSIAATAQGLIAARIKGEHVRGVVFGVTMGGMIDLPDDEYEPAKPRFVFTSTIHARPVATITS